MQDRDLSNPKPHPADKNSAATLSGPLAPAPAISVAQAFANQTDYCRANGAPITARIVAAIAQLLDKPQSLFAQRMAEWTGNALADALPLRAAAGFHALHMAHKAPDLAPIYADATGVNDALIINAVTRRFDGELLPWLNGPPQTNEAGRSSSFIAAMLWLIEQGCPARFDAMEIGSSAGINLMIDRYHYDLGGVHVGPQDAVMRFQPEWRGHHPPQHGMEFASLAGCDVAPINLCDDAQANRLKAYIWPDNPIRFARLEAAIASARAKPPLLSRMNAADFLEQQLGRPQATGTTRVLMHSLVWQYIPDDQQHYIILAMEAAGRAATPDRPLAWISLEANRTLLNHELIVRHWPSAPEPHMVAQAHAHGAWINWL